MLGIVTPVWLQRPALWDLTRRMAATLCCATPCRLYAVPNRLDPPGEDNLRADLQAYCPWPVAVLPYDGTRSVAASWNQGLARAFADGAGYAAVVANDVLLEPDCLDELLRFGRDPANAGVAFWSGVDTRDRPPVDGCDFSCAMLRRETLDAIGPADEGFRPAYHEDNDWYIRAVLSGRSCRIVHAARFYHFGSQTVRLDPEAAHHVSHWWVHNRTRLQEKWGCREPPRSAAEVLTKCYRHPWNDPSVPPDFCGR